MGVRSGEHIKLRGGVYHYRRAVPEDCRKAYGAWEKTKSLETGSKSEAKRLEKELDIEFEAQIGKIRANRDPHAVSVKMMTSMRASTHVATIWRGGFGGRLPEEFDDLGTADQETVRNLNRDYCERLESQQKELAGLFGEIGRLFAAPLALGAMEKFRPAVLPLARSIIEGTPSTARATAHTLPWAWETWVAQGSAGHHTKGSEKQAQRHWKAFLEHSELLMLGEVQRHHLTTWRDTLVGTGELANNSINQRLSLVIAILRTGWREANLPTPDLMKLKVKVGETDRKPWTREEILRALSVLRPNSWQAWLFVIGLTTSVRLGEPVGAMVDWWKPDRGFIETPRRATKKRKFHAIPIVKMLRDSFDQFVKTRPASGYIFDCPRPSNQDEPISNFASRSLNRFLHDKGVDRVFHELRDTWIHEARHCNDVKRELWEIISGHSASTVSDTYGGEQPDVLMAANETICRRFVTEDTEVRRALLRLVGE